MFNRNRGRPSNRLETYALTVEQILSALNIDPERARMPNVTEGFGWQFSRGSAMIEIYVEQFDNAGYLRVLSPILTLPTTGLLPLYRRLLELNLQLTTASLGVYLDTVYVYNERPLEGMDAAEANGIINQVANVADDLDDKLLNEFGGRLYGRI